MLNRKTKRIAKKNLKKVDKIINKLEPKVKNALSKDELSPKTRKTIESVMQDLKEFQEKDINKLLNKK